MQDGGDEAMENDAMLQLKALNARFINNFVTNDARSHDQITHKDFVCVTSTGAREKKAEYITRWATGFDPEVIRYWDYRDEFISIFGSVALVRATNKYVVLKDGKETTGMATYTDTYIQDGAEWKCIQAQIGPVSPENYPADETIVKKYIRGELQE
ncbi:MAG: nuclear transport factor 2 family protein [Dehalococcoidia bacterium]